MMDSQVFLAVANAAVVLILVVLFLIFKEMGALFAAGFMFGAMFTQIGVRLKFGEWL